MTYEATEVRPITKDLDASASSSGPSTHLASTNDADASGSDAAPSESLDAGLFLLPTLSHGDTDVLPSDAPRHVKIGVVLIGFVGAEGAPPNARTKIRARAMADQLGQEARTDFHRAVTAGDPGSADDIGRLPRGVLDPRTEVAVFALSKGEISDVLETPRGYWIVKRLE